MAQAGGSNPQGLDKVMERFKEIVRNTDKIVRPGAGL